MIYFFYNSKWMALIAFTLCAICFFRQGRSLDERNNTEFCFRNVLWSQGSTDVLGSNLGITQHHVQRRQWHPTPVLLPGKSHGQRSLVGCGPRGREESDTTERLHFHALEKEMATHSSVLAWSIPGTGEPGGLLSMGLHRVGHNWSDLAAAALKQSNPKRK